jgi:hypothetical protein
MYFDRMEKEPAPMNADFGSLIAQERVHVALYRGQFAGYVVFYPEGDHLHCGGLTDAVRYKGPARILLNTSNTLLGRKD